jgi:dTMP kinase
MKCVPDRTLLFVGDAQVVLKRLRSNGNLDRIEVEKDEFFLRVYEGFEEIHKAEPDRVHRIDSNRTIDEIFADVCEDINALL